MRTLLMVLVLALAGCAGLPMPSITPISAEVEIAGQTEHEEDNMVALTGAEHTVHADTVEQTYIQEVPLWTVLLIALFSGLALPSPLSAYSGWRERRRLEKQVSELMQRLYESSPTTSGTRPVENPAPDASP